MKAYQVHLPCGRTALLAGTFASRTDAYNHVRRHHNNPHEGLVREIEVYEILGVYFQDTDTERVTPLHVLQEGVMDEIEETAIMQAEHRIQLRAQALAKLTSAERAALGL